MCTALFLLLAASMPGQALAANQVALALRDEIADLEDAGIRIIQVDEPALRELLPLRRAGSWTVAKG